MWKKMSSLSWFFIGICMRRKDAYDRDALHFAPFLLLPSPFPRQEFKRAQELQTLLNELMHKVAHDNEFLEDTLSKTIEVDEFTGRLFKIHQQILSEGGSAQVSWSWILEKKGRFFNDKIHLEIKFGHDSLGHYAGYSSRLHFVAFLLLEAGRNQHHRIRVRVDGSSLGTYS